MKKTIIMIICILVIGFGIYFVNKKMKSHHDKANDSNVVSVLSIYYYHGDDEYGRSTTIIFKNNCITYDYDGGTVDDSNSKSCTTEDSFYDELNDIINKYNVRSWTNLKKSDIEIMDGATSSMKIELSDHTVIELGYGYEMPENGWQAVSEICDLMEAELNKSNQIDTSKEIIPAEDNNLELLVDYCEKRKATVGENGYKEIVLYQSSEDGSYQLHTYEKYDAMDSEEHHAYTASEQIADATFDLIEELDLIKYKDQVGIGLEGKEYIVKFKQNDELIRISSDNLSEDKQNIIEDIGNLLYSYIITENN